MDGNSNCTLLWRNPGCWICDRVAVCRLTLVATALHMCCNYLLHACAIFIMLCFFFFLPLLRPG